MPSVDKAHPAHNHGIEAENLPVSSDHASYSHFNKSRVLSSASSRAETCNRRTRRPTRRDANHIRHCTRRRMLAVTKVQARDSQRESATKWSIHNDVRADSCIEAEDRPPSPSH